MTARLSLSCAAPSAGALLGTWSGVGNLLVGTRSLGAGLLDLVAAPGEGAATAAGSTAPTPGLDWAPPALAAAPLAAASVRAAPRTALLLVLGSTSVDTALLGRGLAVAGRGAPRARSGVFAGAASPCTALVGAFPSAAALVGAGLQGAGAGAGGGLVASGGSATTPPAEACALAARFGALFASTVCCIAAAGWSLLVLPGAPSAPLRFWLLIPPAFVADAFPNVDASAAVGATCACLLVGLAKPGAGAGGGALIEAG